MWPFSRRRRVPGTPRRFRYERFGGIVQLGWPRALVFVDRERARSLGYRDGGVLWNPAGNGAANEAATEAATEATQGVRPAATDEALVDELLSAPLEAHLQLTNRCEVGCQGCYTGATPAGGPSEWGLEAWRRAIDELGERGVFHLALGGGESGELEWLGELARHIRARGMVPNLTTSGLLDAAALERLCAWAPLFGQINVSLDGVGEVYARVRGVDGFDRADQAIRRLRRVTRHVGLNCVLTRENFDHLEALFAYARARRLGEIELLRLKPAGRGAAVYERLRLSDDQHRALLPTVLGLARRHRRRVRLDCSLTPMVAYHQPRPELVRWLAIYGCAGGDLLVAAKAHGVLAACSFAAAPPGAPTAERLGEYWQEPGAFGAFRRWREAEEPCRSCAYLALCRGGCRAVTAHVEGNAARPDPECPRVVDFRRAEGAPRAAPHRHLPVIG